MVAKLQAILAEVRRDIAAGNLLGVLTRFSDLGLALLILTILGLMLVPLPTILLDMLLTLSITIGIVVLMVSLYIHSPVQIASYPTLLLITTLFRLALDIAATRLILLQANAGEVIQQFGQFVVGGNFVVGAVIFLIITLVNFLVITKGAERVAEVSARFTLDAMPGKQMSIDADMRAGIIDFQQARSRREGLSRESQFYGAMDGAMKFVKGDAIAGIVITLINLVGGLAIGIGMKGMPAGRAVATYSILTIGSGLVSQLPALLISISAGFVVTRVASEGAGANLAEDLSSQFLRQPKAIGVAGAMILIMALVFLAGGIPGLALPFMVLAGAAIAMAYFLHRASTTKQEAAVREAPPAEVVEEPEITVTVPLVLQLADDLTPFVDLTTEQGKKFYETLAEVRNSLYYESGIIFPSIQIAGNQPVPPGSYMIFVNEVPLVTGQIRMNALLAGSSAQDLFIYGIKGEETVNPATGKPASWIPREMRDRAEAVSVQVWDTSEILVLHLTHFLRKQAKDFLGLQEVQWMIEKFKQYYPALVEEVTPKPVSLPLLTEILQKLAEEEVSIRDLKTVFQTLAEWGRVESDALALSEKIRAALRHKICYQLSDGKPMLYVYQLDPEVEEMFRNSVRQSSSGPYLNMEPSMIQQVMGAAYQQIGRLPVTAQRPVILTDTDIRRFVKRLLSYQFPEVSVLSYEQLTPQIQVQPVGAITLQAPQLGAGMSIPGA